MCLGLVLYYWFIFVKSKNITEIFQGQQMFSSAVWHITDREIQSPLSFPLDIWISEEEGPSDEAFCLLSSTHSDRPAESQPSCRDTRLIYIYDLHTFTPLLTHLFSVETAHYHDKITKRDTHQGLCSYNKEMQHRLRPGFFHRKQRFLSSV